MKRILFVCHGNICRSPMAEFIMRELLRQHGLEASYEVASAATSTEEIGRPVYPPAQQELRKHGIDASGKRLASSPQRIMPRMTISSAWMRPISVRCSAFAAVIQRARSAGS